jgi:hypothetical protein
MGHHEDGTFDRIEVHDMTEQLEAWENGDVNQQALKRMGLLISRLRNILRSCENKTCFVIYDIAIKPPFLRIHASTSRKEPLPRSVVKTFCKACGD